MSVFQGSQCGRPDKSLCLPRIRDVNRREFDVDSGVRFYSSIHFPDFSDLLVWGFYLHFIHRLKIELFLRFACVLLRFCIYFFDFWFNPSCWIESSFVTVQQ